MGFLTDISIILFVISELTAIIYGSILISQQNLTIGLPLCIIGTIFTTATICYMLFISMFVNIASRR